MQLDRDLSVTVEIAHECGEILLSYFGSDRINVRDKGHRDIVTAADVASEEHVVSRIRESFPEDGLKGEEGAGFTGTSGRTWYCDPLDGTLNYAHGIPVWSVSLSLFEGDVPILGVVYDPIRHETFEAASGLGARLNGTSISAGAVTRADKALVHITVDFHEQSLKSGLEDLGKIAPASLRTRNLGSAALALAYVGCCRFDAMLHRFAHCASSASALAPASSAIRVKLA